MRCGEGELPGVPAAPFCDGKISPAQWQNLIFYASYAMLKNDVLCNPVNNL